MTKEQLAVREFMGEFGQDCPKSPQWATDELADLRVNLISEELDELDVAFGNRDVVGIADALGDLLYVVYGTAIACGIDMEPIFNEIHRSNMTKKGGEKRADGKIMKPSHYSPPHLGPLLETMVSEEK